MSSFCYLLDSDHPRASSLGGRTYIGFTVNPLRRKKQHNGILANGAFKTRKWRPWEMVVLVTGFANQRTALQFEWTWQHGETSLDTRGAILRLKGMVQERLAYAQKRTLKIHGVVGQVLRLMAILSTPPWKYFPLHVRVANGKLWRLVGDAVRMLVGRQGLGTEDSFLLFPEHIGVSVGPLDDFLADIASIDEDEGCDDDGEDLAGTDGGLEGGDREGLPVSSREGTPSPGKVGRKNMKIRCLICLELAQRTWAECNGCGGRTHVGCLAAHYLDSYPGRVSPDIRAVDLPRQPSCLPDRGSCPHCQTEASWEDVLGRLRTAGWRKSSGSTEADATAVTTTELDKCDSNKQGNVFSCRKTTPQIVRKQARPQKTATAPEASPTALAHLEAIICRTEMLQIGDSSSESLASRCLRRLQEQDANILPTTSTAPEVIDLCSSSSTSPSPPSPASPPSVECIDLSGDGCG